jgi:hypothetical protein
MVARYASSNYVIPAMRPTSISRDYMIQSKVISRFPTILTQIPVTGKYFFPRKATLKDWAVHKMDKSYYRRSSVGISYGHNLTFSINNELRSTAPKQNNSPSNITNVERLIVLV